MIDLKTKEEILKSVPIAYYFGYQLDISIEKTQTSYIDIKNLKIVVAEDQIKFDDIESTRSTIYHELSHAILTPSILNSAIDYYISREPAPFVIDRLYDFINIFEDQRIESIMKYEFLKVNFYSNVFKINNTNKETELNKDFTRENFPYFIDYFYAVVRYGYTGGIGEDFLNLINNKITNIVDLENKIVINKNYLCISAFSAYYYTFKWVYFALKNVYENRINNTIENPKEQEVQGVTANQESQPQQEKEENESQEKDNKGASPLIDEGVSEALNGLKNQVKNQLIINDDQTVDRELEAILRKNNGSTVASHAFNYQGANFNVKNYANNFSDITKKYKSFEKKSNAGNIKKNKKTRLIFIQDISGSYDDNRKITAGIYRAVERFYKKNQNVFDYKVYTSLNYHYYLQSYVSLQSILSNPLCGGNCLCDNLEQDIKLKPEPTMYNDIYIILYDGKITIDRVFLKSYFKDKKTIIVSDESNADAFEKLVKINSHAKLYTLTDREYSSKLYQVIKEALKEVRV